jgi:hypothetical protein
MVVPVLITSCHVSLKPNTGPVTLQTMITVTARKNVSGRPERVDIFRAKRVKNDVV